MIVSKGENDISLKVKVGTASYNASETGFRESLVR